MMVKSAIEIWNACEIDWKREWIWFFIFIFFWPWFGDRRRQDKAVNDECCALCLVLDFAVSNDSQSILRPYSANLMSIHFQCVLFNPGRVTKSGKPVYFYRFFITPSGISWNKVITIYLFSTLIWTEKKNNQDRKRSNLSSTLNKFTIWLIISIIYFTLIHFREVNLCMLYLFEFKYFLFM